MDSDTLHKVSETLGLPAKLTQDCVLKAFTDVFEGLGELEGEYIIHTNPDIPTLVHHHVSYPFQCMTQLKKSWMLWLKTK